MKYKIEGIYVDDICELLNEYKAMATEISNNGLTHTERVEYLDTVDKIERLVATLGNMDSVGLFDLRGLLVSFQNYIAHLYDSDDDRVREIQNTINLIDQEL